MDDNKMYAYCWTAAFLTLIIVCFMVTSCVREDNQLSANLKTECARIGGSWVPAQGSSEKYVCQPR